MLFTQLIVKKQTRQLICSLRTIVMVTYNQFVHMGYTRASL